ncbi:uncharacterized protein TNCV_2851621 [Trichonephila clavipes]|nr:uncharacterized protein TNCV_2851621 [Trichonephila clavipes]
MRLSPYPYTLISSIQLETRLFRLGSRFPVINSPMSVLTGPVPTVKLVDSPAIQYAGIRGRSARLSRLMFLVSCHWSRFCMIFFRPQWCRRFDVLPNFRYSRYIREMVTREIPKFRRCYAPSRAPTITPRSNSHKS